MRNLKKILALVLALVMSLSLMATAGATNFKDDESINDTFSESVDVLAGLKVFGGYQDGEFKPQGEITRAEVAAIIYRIVTGQVGEDQSYKIYADYNTFTDVNSADWYAGYINFCANAEYVKGVGNGKFEPQGKVTGYQALAMILRAVGYDKNGEFTGSNWQVQTAATAQSLHITDKISSGTLGGNATREMVAEILCKSILVPQVKYTPAFGYRDYETDPAVKNETLAYSTFKMERLEGVVMANEYADLEDDETLATGKTRIKTEDGAPVLNVTTDLTDIGESRYAYVKPTNVRNDYEMVTSELYDTGANVVHENVGKDLSKDADKISDLLNGLKESKDTTEYYDNFDPYSEWSSEHRIGYFITQTEAAILDGNARYDSTTQKMVIDQSKDYTSGRVWSFLAERDSEGKLVNSSEEVPAPAASNTTAHYGEAGWIRWIPRNTAFEEIDREIIEYIFDNANLVATSNSKDDNGRVIRGEVYVGTQAMTDISDTKSLSQFVKEFINTDATAKTYTSAANGNWLKVIDNDNDGVVDYVLRTNCVLDEIVEASGDKFFYNHIGNGNSTDINYLVADGMATDADVKPAVGLVVVAALIDGKWQAREAVSETATINAISYANHTATSTDGNTYYQSDIDNQTDMDEEIINMNEKTEYTVYKDFFGYVRAYVGPGNAYGLLTEVYPTYSYNSQLVQNRILTAELTRAEDNGATKEYQILNSWNSTDHWNPFYNEYTTNWESVRVWDAINNRLHHDNYLQRAIAMLDVNDNPTAKNVAGDEFDYAEKKPGGDNAHTWTNVAKYGLTDDGVNLYTASELMYDQAGNQYYYAKNVDGVDNGTWARYTQASWKTAFKSNDAAFDAAYKAGKIRDVYAEDYIQLAVNDIGGNKARWNIDADYINYDLSNGYINATVDTDFYVVSRSNNTDVGGYVRYYKGYNHLPAYTIDDNDIRAIYAVAKNTRADNVARDYWVADVIVIELGEIKDAYSSISLAYFNDSKQTGSVRFLKTLNNKATGIMEDLIPDGYTWSGRWTKQDFYGLTGETTDDNGVKHASIESLGKWRDDGKLLYNSNNIWAGYVERMDDLKTYVVADTGSDEYGKVDVTFTSVPIYTVTSTSASTTFWSDRVNGNDPTGHQIIWVGSKSGPSFIIDLGKVGDGDGSVWANTPGWLKEVYNLIIEDEKTKEVSDATMTGTFYGEPIDMATRTGKVSYTEAVAGTEAITFSINKAGKTITNKDAITVTKNGVAYNAKKTLSSNGRELTIEIDKAVEDEVKWVVTMIVTTDGTPAPETYTLTQLAANKGVTLSVKDSFDNTGNTIVMANGLLQKPVKAMDLLSYIQAFKAADGATVEWTFTRTGATGSDKNIVVKADANGNIIKEDGAYTEAELKSMYTTGISDITAKVTNDTDKTGRTYRLAEALADVTVTLGDGVNATLEDGKTAMSNPVKATTVLVLTADGDVNFKTDKDEKIPAKYDETTKKSTATWTVGSENVTISKVDKNAPVETVKVDLTGVSGMTFKQNGSTYGSSVPSGKVQVTASTKGNYEFILFQGSSWADALAGTTTNDKVLRQEKVYFADKPVDVDLTVEENGWKLAVVKYNEDTAPANVKVTTLTDVNGVAGSTADLVVKTDKGVDLEVNNNTVEVLNFDKMNLKVEGWTITNATSGATNARFIYNEDGSVTYLNNATSGAVNVTLTLQKVANLEAATEEANETATTLYAAFGTSATAEAKAKFDAAMKDAKTEADVKDAVDELIKDTTGVTITNEGSIAFVDASNVATSKTLIERLNANTTKENGDQFDLVTTDAYAYVVDYNEAAKTATVTVVPTKAPKIYDFSGDAATGMANWNDSDKKGLLDWWLGGNNLENVDLTAGTYDVKAKLKDPSDPSQGSWSAQTGLTLVDNLYVDFKADASDGKVVFVLMPGREEFGATRITIGQPSSTLTRTATVEGVTVTYDLSKVATYTAPAATPAP